MTVPGMAIESKEENSISPRPRNFLRTIRNAMIMPRMPVIGMESSASQVVSRIGFSPRSTIYW